MELEERWGFMVPWCTALKHKLEYRQPEYGSQTRYLRVLVPLRTVIEEHFEFYDGPDTFDLIREGLALLAAVAYVDYKGWRYLLEKYCAVPLGQEGDELYEEEIPVHFVLTLDWNAGRRGWNRQSNMLTEDDILLEYAKRPYTEDVLQFCGVHQQENHSRAYVHYLSRIAAFLKEDKPRVDIKIPVQVRFQKEFADLRALNGIVKAEKLIEEERQDDQIAPTELLQCSFLLKPTLVNCSNGSIDSYTSKILGNILQDNVHLDFVSLLPSKDVSRDEEFGRFMRLLLASDRPCQIGSVAMDCIGWIPNRGPEMLLSALAQTRTTTHLNFGLMEEPNLSIIVTSIWWKWIAYGLFSKRARTCSSMETLFINEINEMRTSDMEMFAAVVESENSEEELFDSPRGRVEAREATLQPGSLIQWQITSQGGTPPPSLTSEDPIPFVWTFSDDGESAWVNAVVPGYGRCRVQRCDLVFSNSTAVNENRNGVSSLVLSFSDDDPRVADHHHGPQPDRSGLPRFLSAVGSTLKVLVIHKENVRFDDNLILQSCPRLEELVLCGKWVEVRLNFSEYHKKNQPFPTLANDWDNIAAISAALSDRGSPLTRCLHKLRVYLYICTFNNREEQYRCPPKRDVEKLLEMLERNRTLQYLEVIAHSYHSRYQDEFRKFHLKPIAVQERPLSMECKAAFLSVYLSNSPSRTKKPKSGEVMPPLAVLDCFVSSMIFAFAADPVQRKVFFSNDGHPRDLANI